MAMTCNLHRHLVQCESTWISFFMIGPPQLSIRTSLEPFSDSRTHGYQGPTRSVRLPRTSTTGGGAISKSEDGLRAAVTGQEC